MNVNELRVDILKKEIDVISQKINHFDDLRLKTRQMCIAVWVAVVGFGLKDSNLPHSVFLFFLASLIPLPFWYIESTYRRRYKGWSERFKAIRKFIRDGEFELPGGKIVKYIDFIDSKNTNTNFPLFDYWAQETIDKKIRKEKTALLRSLLNPKIFWIYFSMVMIAGVLSVFKLQGILFMISLFALILICLVVLTYYIKNEKKRKDEPKYYSH